MVSFLTSTDSVSYTENLMERITDSIVPISDSVATATLMDGFMLSQIDYLGGKYTRARNNSIQVISQSYDTKRRIASEKLKTEGHEVIK